MRDRLMVVDGNWLIHRAFHSLRGRSSRMDITLPLRVVGWVCKYAVEKSCNHAVVAIDGDSIFRYTLYPQYKASRREGKDKNAPVDATNAETDSVYASLESLQNLMNALELPWHQHHEYEADDLLASYAAQMHKDFSAVVLLCKDKDPMQAVNDANKVSIFTPGSENEEDRTLREADVVAAKGFTPAQWLDYQTLVGDSGDDIPSLLKPAAAKKAIQEHGSLKAFLSKSEVGKTLLEERGEDVLRNRKLVKLVTNVPCKMKAELSLSRLKPQLVKTQLPRSVFEAASAFSTSRKTLFD